MNELNLTEIVKNLPKAEDWTEEKAAETVREFRINRVEWERGNSWLNQHLRECPGEPPRNAGHSFIFQPGHIGVTVHIRCNDCKAEGNITDYDLW